MAVERNVVSGNQLATSGVVECTATTAGTTNQIYRNTDNKHFKPVLLVLTNRSTTQNQRIQLVDTDETDAGTEDDNNTVVKYEYTVLAEDTVSLKEEDLKGLIFRYGVCCLVSTAVSAGSGVAAYIAGVEV